MQKTSSIKFALAKGKPAMGDGLLDKEIRVEIKTSLGNYESC